ncbi:MAG TPA: DUF2750 domain-containing protein [Saprospiraceae bacterium]|nr:DUF2750 domain-containing protein [Saprospiraceae bacterium]
MNTAEVNSTFKMPGEKRLALFIEAVAQSKRVFSIGDDEGWALLGDDDDTDIVPLFHHAELAEAFRKAANFSDCQVEEMAFEDLLAWLDDLTEDGMMVAVCPNPRFEGAILEAEDLKQDLINKTDRQ